jgi:hypothetical protein
MSKVERLRRKWPEKCVGFWDVDVMYAVSDAILVQCVCPATRHGNAVTLASALVSWWIVKCKLAFCFFSRGILRYAFCVRILWWQCKCCCRRISKMLPRKENSVERRIHTCSAEVVYRRMRSAFCRRVWRYFIFRLHRFLASLIPSLPKRRNILMKLK